jgi:hypothetical protein
MRYLRKYLQRVGLVLTLLIIGVLGGLMVPLPSEAQPPTLTIAIDGQPAESILGTASTCSSTEQSNGYNFCYNIVTSTTTSRPTSTSYTGRKYTVQRSETNVAARLRIGDFAGQDKFQLAGLKIVPVPWVVPTGQTTAQTEDINTNEVHTIVIRMSNAFNNTTNNSGNRGTYVFALRTGGEFVAGPAGNLCNAQPAPNQADKTCDTIGDSVTYTGVGTFSPTVTNANILRPSGTNSQPLTFTVAGPHADPITSFDGADNTSMGQIDPTYPFFACDDNGATAGGNCRPTITQTLTISLRGQDSFVLTGVGDVEIAACSQTISIKQKKQITILTFLLPILEWLQSQHPSQHLEQLIEHIRQFLLTVNSNPNGEGYGEDCPGAKVVSIGLANGIVADAIQYALDGAVNAVAASPHYYAVVSTPPNYPLTWVQARAAAQALGTEGNVCDLATITSGSEQAIINVILPNPSDFPAEPAQDYWIGGIQDNCDGDGEGGGGGAGCHWRWINGEGEFWNNGSTGMYANWGSTSTGPANEPNNYNGSENHLTVDHRYGWGWNDLNNGGATGTTNGYITEGTTAPCVPTGD